MARLLAKVGNFPNESLVLVLGAGDPSKVLVASERFFVKGLPYFLIEKALCQRVFLLKRLLCKGNGVSLVLANKGVLCMEKALSKGISLWIRLFAKL